MRTGSLAATLAIVDGDTVAMAVTTPQDQMLEMLALVVDESHRRHRIGQALAEHVLAAAHAWSMGSQVSPPNSASIEY